MLLTSFSHGACLCWPLGVLCKQERYRSRGYRSLFGLRSMLTGGADQGKAPAAQRSAVWAASASTVVLFV